MQLNIFKSKIHRATVTDANINYEGSIAIDSVLMRAANIFNYEAVHIWNVTNGSRFITYAIEASDSGVICLNGAAAKLCDPGDIVIIATFANMTKEEAGQHKPTIIFVDKNNKLIEEKQFEEMKQFEEIAVSVKHDFAESVNEVSQIADRLNAQSEYRSALKYGGKKSASLFSRFFNWLRPFK